MTQSIVNVLRRPYLIIAVCRKRNYCSVVRTSVSALPIQAESFYLTGVRVIKFIRTELMLPDLTHETGQGFTDYG